MAAIVARVVKQPFNCKGRYVALSALLQKVGPTSLLAAAGGEALVGSLFAAAAADMSVAGPAVTLLSHLLAALAPWFDLQISRTNHQHQHLP